MAEITGAELSLDRFISEDPANGLVATLNSDGTVSNLVSRDQATGDVTWSAPANSSGTNTRRHLFDRPIVSTGFAAFGGAPLNAVWPLAVRRPGGAGNVGFSIDAIVGQSDVQYLADPDSGRTSGHLFYTSDGTTRTLRGGFASTGQWLIQDGVTAPAAVTGFASIYVDSADGDLKIKFSDGVTKTIVVDT